VYKEVCATCHGLKRIRFRNLKALGFNEAQIKAIASQYEVTDGPNAEGQMFKRKSLPSDAFPNPYANDNAARAANNGSLPPDLSLIIKARNSGPDYVYSLLTGYDPPPAGTQSQAGQYYNTYFPGNFISMAPPLTEGQVTYADGTKASVEQMAKDVVSFLAWSAEPEMEQRKQTGVKVIVYLLFMTILFYMTKRRIWRHIK
jgi:ubiquinol-cytochrome c reductase cytochrome c1 subunit